MILITIMGKTLELIDFLEKSGIMDVLLIFFGAILGFLGSYINFKITDKKDFNKTLDKFIIELNMLAQEIIYNTYSLKEEAYISFNHKKQIKIKLQNNEDCRLNEIEYKESIKRLEEHLKERNLLYSRLIGKIQEYNLTVGYSYEVEQLFNEVDRYDFKKDPFEFKNNLKDLENALGENFTEKIKMEFEETFSSTLKRLVNTMIKNIQYKRDKKIINWLKNVLKILFT